jgi:hypothetical protein
MKMNIKRYIEALHVVFLALIIAGCGGGGGGGDDSSSGGGGGGGGSSSTITATNAAFYAANVGYLGDISDITDNLVTQVFGVEVENQGKPPLGQFINWLLDQLPQLQYQVVPNTVVSVIPDQTIPCPTGNAVVSWTDADSDDQISNGDSVEVTFNGCLGLFDDVDTVDGVLASNEIALTGDLNNLALGATLSTTVSFVNFQYTWADGVETVNGSVDINIDTSDGVVFNSTYTGVIHGAGNETGFGDYTYDYTNMNLVGSVDNATDAYSNEMNGDINDSELGTFSVVTSSAFEGVGNANPNTGNATVTALDNSSVTLDVVDASNVRLLVDTDGDDVDEDTINMTWAELNSI